MRRWNGWGSNEIDFPLSPSAENYLSLELGKAKRGPSSKFEDVLGRVPRPRISPHPLISTNAELRVLTSRGQSLPDWIALRFGTVDSFPDGVARPTSEDEIEKLISYAKQTGTRLIPYGGGTSVVGHINPPRDERPSVTVDLRNLRELISLDEKSRLATLEAGATGPHLEAQLRARGYTLGHFPQSFEYSTLGGWIATRSSGQQSLYYGRIEDLFAGGRVITPSGKVELPPFPASAAGPDIRHILLGSEGRFGIITRATVRISSLPEEEKFHGLFFPDWEKGSTAVRELAQNRIPLSLLRLSNSLETRLTLLLAGRERLVQLLNRLLRARGLGEEKCLLIFGVTGKEADVKRTRRVTLDICRSYGGVYVGKRMGNEWKKNRFKTPYLRNTLWEHGYAVDTLESAFSWSSLLPAAQAILKELEQGLLDTGEKALSFAHISHVYQTGAGIYVTYLFRLASSAQETFERWKKLKHKASKAIISQGGTISHQHGVGTDHLPYLEPEKGKVGLAAIEALSKNIDPHGIMNPGKLIKIKD